AFGPGHCSFSTAVDGSIWMIYHANLVSGTGWGGRSVWIAPVTFAEDGTPIFGKPQKEVQFPVALK
ncbi:MAG: glycosyl hydrolase family 43, partial [Clostridia bacterium]|nr:glycosyl hydrolase family 43 [Clostridia bacterium]